MILGYICTKLQKEIGRPDGIREEFMKKITYSESSSMTLADPFYRQNFGP